MGWLILRTHHEIWLCSATSCGTKASPAMWHQLLPYHRTSPETQGTEKPQVGGPDQNNEVSHRRLGWICSTLFRKKSPNTLCFSLLEQKKRWIKLNQVEGLLISPEGSHSIRAHFAPVCSRKLCGVSWLAAGKCPYYIMQARRAATVIRKLETSLFYGYLSQSVTGELIASCA